jgi:hypothetical protein
MRTIPAYFFLFVHLSCKPVMLKKDCDKMFEDQLVSVDELKAKLEISFMSSTPLLDEDCSQTFLYFFRDINDQDYFVVSKNYNSQKSYNYEQRDTTFIDSVRSIVHIFPKVMYYPPIISLDNFYTFSYSRKFNIRPGWATFNGKEHFSVFVVKNKYMNDDKLDEREHIKYAFLVYCDRIEFVSVDELEEMEFQF